MSAAHLLIQIILFICEFSLSINPCNNKILIICSTAFDGDKTHTLSSERSLVTSMLYHVPLMQTLFRVCCAVGTDIRQLGDWRCRSRSRFRLQNFVYVEILERLIVAVIISNVAENPIISCLRNFGIGVSLGAKGVIWLKRGLLA